MKRSGIYACTVLVVLVLTGCAERRPARVPTVRAADPVASLRADLDRLFSDPLFASAHWGVEVVSLDRGDLLYERNSAKLLLPASNNKLLTAAVALLRLGPDFRFETRVCTDGQIAGGRLKGNLIIIGSGDPTLSPRFHKEDPLEVFRRWASKLKEAGVQRIEGDIIGVDGFPDQTRLGRGWGWDDLAYGYAAPISGLQFHDNLVTMVITPGEKEGDSASAGPDPPLSYFSVECHILTGPPGAEPSVLVERGARKGAVILRGSVPLRSPPIRQTVSADDPALFLLHTLRETLVSEGIDASASLIKVDRPAPASAPATLWTNQSPPLAEIIRPLLKNSQNLYAETLVRTLGLKLRGDGSFAKGREVVEETLRGMAIEKGTYSYADGSGLSRLNMVSPGQLIRLLKFMYRHELFNHFYDALPIAGVDGTIEDRMKGTRAGGNVRAKTGTLAHVRSLSGYLKTAEGEMLAFSMLANGFLVSNRAAEYVQDSALERLASFTRKNP